MEENSAETSLCIFKITFYYLAYHDSLFHHLINITVPKYLYQQILVKKVRDSIGELPSYCSIVFQSQLAELVSRLGMEITKYNIRYSKIHYEAPLYSHAQGFITTLVFSLTHVESHSLNMSQLLAISCFITSPMITQTILVNVYLVASHSTSVAECLGSLLFQLENSHVNFCSVQTEHSFYCHVFLHQIFAKMV